MPGIESKILVCPCCCIVTLLTVLSELLLVSVKYCYFKDMQSICHMGEKNSVCRASVGKQRKETIWNTLCTDVRIVLKIDLKVRLEGHGLVLCD